MAEAHTTAGTEAPAHETEAVAFGFLSAPMAISIAMIVVLVILVWKKVPAAIGSALDNKISAIRDQLAEAETLRKEAEALKAEYVAKAAQADTEAKAMLERARLEAEAMVEKARKDADALVERRGRMAEEKIAAEERAALQKLRAAAADVATRATVRLIAEHVDANADAALIDSGIKGLARR